MKQVNISRLERIKEILEKIKTKNFDIVNTQSTELNKKSLHSDIHNLAIIATERIDIILNEESNN